MAIVLITALALVLILEGLLPFFAPKLWRDTLKRIMELTDGQIRFMGLSALALGVLLLLFSRL